MTATNTALLLTATIITTALVCPAFSQTAAAPFHLYPQYARYLNRRPAPLKEAFYFRADTDEKIVALTIDDGPSAYTEKLTALLKRKECPAAFFLVGRDMTAKNIKYYDDTLFEIGSHSYNHYNMDAAANINTMRRDFQRSVDKHRSLMPERALKYYRPPYGIIHKNVADQMNEHGLQGVLWSFDTMDFAKPARQTVIRNINTRLVGGDIILLHEAINLTLLENMIDTIRSNNFRIVKLSELMAHPPAVAP